MHPLHNFYSQAPRGARPDPPDLIVLDVTISTHTPLAGRDVLPFCVGETMTISTHTPLAGRDRGTVHAVG